MVALQASEARVQTAVAAWQTTHPQAAALSIAAVNGPASVVLSGSSAAVMSVAASLAAEGIKQQLLKVSHAFHSPLMAPMLQAFQEVAASIRYSPARMRIVSAVTGKIAGKELATPDYWVRHVVEPVRFADSVATLHKLGAQTFLEIGPKPVLLGMVGECLEALAGPAANTQPVNFYTLVEAARRHDEIAIGYRRMGHSDGADRLYGVRLNPNKAAMIQFAAEDQLIVLAED